MCQHRIDILNLFNNEVINHRFLLVKGIVIGYSNCPNKSNVHLNVKGVADDRINYLMTDTCSLNGRFNCLLDLGKGSYDDCALHFSYCNANTCRTIIYKPKSSKYKLQPLLILARDENDDNVETNSRIIELNMLLVQSVFADKLREAGKGRLTFDMIEKCQILRCHLSQEQIWRISEKQLWEEILETINNTLELQSPYMKYMTFINCSKYDGIAVEQSKDYSYSNIKLHLLGHAALSGGSVAVFSSAFFYSWPQYFEDIYKCFLNTKQLDLLIYPDESNYRQTWCGVYASTLGAVCHEIGHMFHLGHTINGFMGNGLDYINRVFIPNNLTEHLAQRLSDHLDNGNNTVNQPPRCTAVNRYSQNGYLQRYHEQRQHEGFYIPSNCAIILSHSLWFRNDADDLDDVCHEEFQNQCRLIGNTFESPTFPLQLLEIRSVNNQIVQWYRVNTSLKSAAHKFILPNKIADLQNNCILFALSTEGHVAFFPKEPLIDKCTEIIDDTTTNRTYQTAVMN